MKGIVDKLGIGIIALCIGAFTIFFTGCSGNGSVSTDMQAKMDSMTNVLKMYTDGKDSLEQHLGTG